MITSIIGLKIGQKFLELGKGKITIEIYNQLLQVGIIRDNFSYAFTLPYTALNESILGSVGKVGSTDLHQTDFTCQIYLYNNLWATGILIVEEAQPYQYFKVKINFDWGAFSEAIGDKKLRDIYNSLLLSTADRSQTLSTTDTTYNYFKIDIEWFYLFEPPVATGAVTSLGIYRNGTQVAAASITYPISDMEAVTIALVNNFNANGAVNSDFRAYYRKDEGDVLTRHIDILPLATNNNDTWILRRAETGDLGTVITDTDFTKIDETAPTINFAYTHICFPRVRAGAFYGSTNEDFLSILNDNTSTLLNYNTILWLSAVSPAEPTDYNRYAHCPCLKLFSLITQICKSVGWTWAGELASDTILEDLLIYSNYATDQRKQIGMYSFNEHQRSVFFGDIVPDLTVKEFFEQIQELFCLYYEIDATQKIIYINFKQTVFEALPTDSLRTRFAQRREVLEKKKNVLLKYNDELNIASYYAANPTQGTFQNTDTYNIRAGAVPHDFANPALWNEKGNSPMFGLGTTNNRSKMYLFFWRGTQSVQGTNRPTAEGIDTYGTGSLSWSYLYENYWKGYVNYLLTNKKQEGVIWLELNFIRKALRSLARKYEYDNLHYLIERITCEIDSENAHIAGAKIELRKLGL